MRWSKEERAFAVEAYFSNGPTKAHITVTRSQCKGFSWRSRGLSPLQWCTFCLFTQPETWKWAWSLKNTGASGGRASRSDSQVVWRALKSSSVNFCTSAILYGRKRFFSWRICLTVLSEISRAAACLQAERLGERTNDCLNVFGCSDALCKSLVFFFHITADPKWRK